MKTHTKILVAALLVIGCVLFRVVPHAANVAPVMAIALVSGVYLGRSYALVVPLVAMLLSDLLIGFYSAPVMLSVYGSIALVCALAYALKKYNSLETRIAASVVASTVFFLATNWAVWQFSTMYENTFLGLIESYTLALPFYRNALVGDLFFTLSLFGAFELASYLSAKHVLKKATA